MMYDYRKSVVAIIINEENKFLLVQENDKKEDFGFIQGGIEDGETPEQALRRELNEEINLTNFHIVRKCNYQNKYDYPEHIQEKHKIKGQIQTVFVVRMSLNHNNLSLSDEIKKVVWFDKDDVLCKLPYENLKTTFNESIKETGI